MGLNLVKKMATQNLHHEHEEISVGFEVLTAVVIKSSVIWDITLCSPLKGN
jgi:hypothetical protein